MLADVKQATIKPLIKATIIPGSLIYTDEYAIYSPNIIPGQSGQALYEKYCVA